VRRREFITLLGGAAAAWPLAARAQQPERVRRVGVLMGYSESDPEPHRWIEALLQGLQQQGWIEGRTIGIEYRWATGNVERMRSQAEELAALKPDVILVASSPALAAMTQATPSIPVVFVNVADPLEQGFIENLARPGGNISGFTAFEPSIAGKWIETLKLISPTLANVAAVYNPQTSPYFPLFYRFLEIAAAQLNVKPIAIPVQDAASMQLAIDGLAQPNAGLVVVPSAFMAIHRDLIITLAARKRLPAIYGWNYFATSGGLVSYGFDPADPFRRASSYIDKILKGAKPGDLPVQNPTRFYLVVNMKTAKALGLDVPPSLLARADEVIE
jgi:ABC-type uncharacterized transport system substrate-binding protein